jgi:DNA topoisomerase I
MGSILVIVESPAKARTIARFLGNEYTVAPSIGHVRDLPESAADVPTRLKKHSWARLGVDIEHGFQPIYVIPAEKKEQVRKLKALCDQADVLYLATDEDREGESISWHLKEVLEPRIPVHRLVFHEITPEAIAYALGHPRDVDMDLVRAQETRRTLDRLFGYEVSPLLWKKVRPKLSAGRVQSVAVRLLVERERARMAFCASAYWDLAARFEGSGGSFEAQLVAVGGRPVAGRADFDPTTGSLKPRSRALQLDEAGARRLALRLTACEASVADADEKPFGERPSPPFITSTIQQEANRRFRWTARRTMQVAQRLYENGWITYMRTDSTALSQEALTAAREAIEQAYGAGYVPSRPRTWRSQSKNAQEAHEAIRPAGRTFRSQAEAAASLDPEEARLYELIFKRTLACQMPDAEGLRKKVLVQVDDTTFQASGRTYTFPGYRRVYVATEDETNGDRDESESLLPALTVGQMLVPLEMRALGHETLPPARLTEATLIKELETRGIGRPSTYASIIDTILARGYVFKKGASLVPTFTAFAVTNLLVAVLSDLVDYAFTADMEDELDQIALGRKNPLDYLLAFYKGDRGLVDRLKAAVSEVDAREICSIPIGLAADAITVHVGRYGPFLADGDRRVDVPEDLPPDELDVGRAKSLLDEQARWPQLLGTDPSSGRPVLVMNGPFGPYLQLGDVAVGIDPPPKSSGKRAPRKPAPVRASLVKGIDPLGLDLSTALKLLSLPRKLGHDPDSNEDVVLANGRFGPYLTCGTTTRSLPDPMRVLDLELDEALSILRAPRSRREAGQRIDLGPDPESGAMIRILSGRFGPYVTDGTVNASLPRGADPAQTDLSQARELLERKRGSPAKPPPAGRGQKRARSSPPRRSPRST